MRGAQCARHLPEHHGQLGQGSSQPTPARSLPAFCEVTATVKPVEGSNIKVVYRLPESWNGKLLGLGGGGWAGNVVLPTAAPGLIKGYATAQTNGGHEVGNTKAGTPEHVGHVLVGESGSRHRLQLPRHPRDDGCGQAGGREVLRRAAEARVLPGLLHGWSSGADGSAALSQRLRRHHRRRAGLHADDADDERRAQSDSSAPGASLSAAQLKHLNDAALAACDGRDGLVDGVVADPRSCTFDPDAAAVCGREEGRRMPFARSGEGGECAVLAHEDFVGRHCVLRAHARQRSWLGALHVRADAADSRGLLTGGPGAGLGGLRPLVFGDANLDLPNFKPDRDYRTVRTSKFADGYEAKNPDLSPFVKHGGKLLLWHGMDDPGPSVLATIEYYEQMKATTSSKLSGGASGAQRQRALLRAARRVSLPRWSGCR